MITTYYSSSPIAALIGETLTSITGMAKGSEQIDFVCASGRTFTMWYEHECCARCDVEDVIGDPADLLNSPILMAEDVSSDESLAPSRSDDAWPTGSETWTFIKFATAKGYVTLRWYGSSNGYYSEEPSFRENERSA